ncbi:hypothetical protein GCM10008932_07930 [Alkalibacterium iburiense]|uniref:Beta-xylanase n=1 Tax=Alkalibacterium iburiense TaxID=290589 RepID=A0ABN0X821_9LACT
MKTKLQAILTVIVLNTLLIGVVFPSASLAESDDGYHITFEEGLEGFGPRGENETIEQTNEDAYEGEYALKVTGRTEAWNGPSLQIAELVEESMEYHFSVRVKLVDEGSAELQLSTQIGEGTNASYQTIDTQRVNSHTWKLLEGTYRYDSIVDDFISVYVESSGNDSVSYMIDDFTLTPTGNRIETPAQSDIQSIKEVYEDYFLIGNAVSMSELAGQRLELLKEHHNLVTAENAMKPESSYNGSQQFDVTDQMRLVDRVKEEGLLLHGHVLVWHQQSPEWMHTSEGERLSREEALTNMESHIEATILAYGDSVISWDVVNEAMNDNPIDPEMWRSMLRRSEWAEAIGDDYVELAFMKAREVLDENGWHDVKLYYNDYNDDNQNKATAIYYMVKEINETYAENHPGERLIDGVGMQGHYNMGTSVDNVRQSLERFKELDVEIGITELDITANTTSELTEEEEIAQGILYAQLFSLYKEHSDVISRVTFWGLNDSTSWRAERRPLLFDGNLQPKKAYEAVIDPEGFLATYASEEEKVENRQAVAVYGTPEIDEELDELWYAAETIDVDRYQMAWQGATGVGRLLWDDDYLYVLVEVDDSTIDTTGGEDWEQDSIEVFLSETRHSDSSYKEGDGQYRVNADGEESIGETTALAIDQSLVTQTDTGYSVQMAVEWQVLEPEEGDDIGFDLQINDATSGNRESVAIWNDLSGQGYQNPTVFGELELVGQKVEAEGISLNNTESERKDTSLLIILGGTMLVGIGAYFYKSQKTG